VAFTRSKLTIFFQSNGGGNVPPVGWTETWYTNDTDPELALARCKAYCNLRRQLLGLGAVITGYRVSDTATIRSTRVDVLTGKDGQSSIFTADPEDAFDPAHEDLLSRVESGENYRRSMFLSGMPDSVTNQLKNQGVTAAFVTNAVWTNLANFITARFLIRVKKKDNPNIGTIIFVPISGIIPKTVRHRNRGRPFDLFRGRRG